MNEPVVVDTNVIRVANRQHQGVSDACIGNCVQHLSAIMAQGHFVVDQGWLIVGEYMGKGEPNKGKAVGDVFLKWVLQNLSNAQRCTQVPITEISADNYVEFPSHPDLANFDAPDRKFVAVANAHPDKPRILQAADSKWINWHTALKTFGIHVDFVCRADLNAFYAKKFGNAPA